MAAKGFGQRGAPPRTAAISPRMTVAPRAVASAPRMAVAAVAAGPAEDIVDAPPARPADDGEVMRLLSLFPILTIIMVLALMLVFLLEKRLAPDVSGNALGIGSIVALGGASRKLVFEGGEWQRLFLAPVFHASLGHLVGNCIALVAIGFKLEPLIGRWWMCAIFALSAMGGMAGSMIGNPPDITTVGASGAITGLIGALFAMSFHSRADDESKIKMQRTALFFGVPAIAPLLWSSTSGGGTDYYAHFGGAVVGLGLGVIIGLAWNGDSFRPGLEKFAAAVTVVFLALVGVSAAFAATRFKSHAASYAHLIPLSEAQGGLDIGLARANELAARYPRDPRAHLFRAFALMKTEKLLAAEEELKLATAHAHELGPARGNVEQVANATLALIYVYQGRRAEAQALARKACAGKLDGSLRRPLAAAKLCS